MKPILTCVVEEHHEAFYFWQYLLEYNYIAKDNNVLWHIDEHSDMATPLFAKTIHNLDKSSLYDKLNFTYEQLSIANFIVPSIYSGLISKVVWIKKDHKILSSYEHDMFVKSYNNDGIKLITGRCENIKDMPGDQIIKYFKYHLHKVDDLEFEENILLDIDLDYFSCTGDPNILNEIKIEITEEEYIKFNSNRYHKVNFLQTGRVESETTNGKYYYVFNRYPYVYHSSTKVQEDEILRYIDRLIDKLNATAVKPQAITICRSRHSGYTSQDQWEFIEENLLSALRQLYNIKTLELNECV